MNSPMQMELQAEYQIMVATHQFFSALSNGNSRVLNELAEELIKLEKMLASTEAQLPNTAPGSLKRIKQVLYLFDQHLPAANLRRHFEQFGTPAQDKLEGLLRFYLSKPAKTTADRDKVDLIVTRWGHTKLSSQDRRNYLQRVPDLADRLAVIYHDLGLSTDSVLGETNAISQLVQERHALLGIGSLRELIDRQVLLRLRKLKDDMDEVFFRPLVLVEVVEINLCLHNIFQQLLTAEQSQPGRVELKERVESKDHGITISPVKRDEVSELPALPVEPVVASIPALIPVSELAVAANVEGHSDRVVETIPESNATGADESLAGKSQTGMADSAEDNGATAIQGDSDIVIALAGIGETLAALALQVQTIALKLATAEKARQVTALDNKRLP